MQITLKQVQLTDSLYHVTNLILLLCTKKIYKNILKPHEKSKIFGALLLVRT